MDPAPTEAELRAAHDVLSKKWLTPSEFEQTTEIICKRCESRDWFNSPHLKFLHDAYVLARFAQSNNIERVRLAGPTDQWPDGYVQTGKGAHNVEITSTHGGRKLGDEYRVVTDEWRADPVENWAARAASIPKYLEEVVSAKSKKLYSSPCWLVVYLNVSEYGIRQKETENVIATVKARYAASFEAITVLWKGQCY